MKLITDGRYQSQRSVLALGMFDGVHIGHRVLMERARRMAARLGAELIVCTFAEHPLKLIAPDRLPPQLTTLEERAALMEALGADVFYALPVDGAVLDMEPEVYAGHLVRWFHPLHVVCGYNHHFGKGGKGTPALLAALGAGLGFGVTVVPEIRLDGNEVSSSAIRAAIVSGDVARAARLLSRPYALNGRVTGRDGRRVSVAFTEKGKPLPHPGAYLIRLTDGARAYPVKARLYESAAMCTLDEAAPLGADVRLEWLR